MCFARWLLSEQCVRQPVSDPEPGGPAASAPRLSDPESPGGTEGVGSQAGTRGPATPREPEDPGRGHHCLLVFPCV